MKYIAICYNGTKENGNQLTWTFSEKWRLDGKPVEPMAMLSVAAFGGNVIGGDQLIIRTVEQVLNDETLQFVDGEERGRFTSRGISIEGDNIYFNGFSLQTDFKIEITALTEN